MNYNVQNNIYDFVKVIFTLNNYIINNLSYC